ncbi:MAG: hypothetical protein A2W80_18285 [Candidatus Riflebacteria bacterium GWC2_50_8]|nr:MAG: hypothetical protein A2W80_18285 [Candidatus Riflebacteria bacterium GWC2_50_8]
MRLQKARVLTFCIMATVFLLWTGNLSRVQAVTPELNRTFEKSIVSDQPESDQFCLPPQPEPTEMSAPAEIPLDEIPADIDCEIDLIKNRFGNRKPDAIKLIEGPCAGKAVIKLTLDPKTTEFTKARIEILYGKQIDSWSLNIGDSRSNNGYGGDSADQTHDSEAQIIGADLTIIGDDCVPEGTSKVLASMTGLAEPGATLVFDLANNRLAWRNDKGLDGEVKSPYLFCLDGQEDKEGPVNYDIFVGLNQVVNGTYRSGCGAIRTRIKLLHTSP